MILLILVLASPLVGYAGLLWWESVTDPNLKESDDNQEEEY